MSTENTLTIQKENNVYGNAQSEVQSLIKIEENKVNQITTSVEGRYGNITDRLLSNHKMADAGELGNQLNSLIMLSKEYDPEKFNKKGFIGKLFSFMSNTKEKLDAHRQSVDQRVERVVQDMDKQIKLHENRQNDMEDLMNYNRNYHNELTIGIDKLKEVIVVLEEKKSELERNNNNEDTFDAVDIYAMENQINRVHALIEELENNRIRSKQVAIELEEMKQTGITLIQTVKTSKLSLIPNWKMALIQFIMGEEQTKTIQHQDAIRNANDEAMAKLGTRIGENAKNANRLLNTQTTSLDRLTKLNEQMIDYKKELDQMNENAKKQREDNKEKRRQLEISMAKNFSK